MIGYWISFSIIFVLIPFIFFCFVYRASTKIKTKLSKEQKARTYKISIYFILFYWLCDLFYMACFINNLMCKYIVGGLILIIIFINLVGLCSLSKEKNIFERFELFQDFIVCIGLSVYLIWTIPNKDIQSIIVPIIAAVYGGLITLAGVGWTINKLDKDRKEDEVKRLRPIFSYRMLRSEPLLDTEMQKICLSETNPQDDYKCEVNVKLENSNQSSFEIKRLYHDDKWIKMLGNKIVLPNDNCILNFQFSNNPENIFVEVEDLLKNKYYYKLKILCLGAKNKSGKFMHTVMEINEILEEDMNKLIKKN